MGIPLSYNLRNLVVRRTTSLLTVTGVAITVAVLVAVLGVVGGLKRSFVTTGHPDNLLVTRKSATSELVSSVSRQDFQIIKALPGIVRTAEGEPVASLEMVTVINLEGPGLQGGMNVNLRGMQPIGLALREQVRIIEGRMFEPGQREVVVGRGVANRYSAARIGGQLAFGRGLWTVVGIMDAGVTAYNSEVFADSNLASTEYGRTAVLSSVLLRAAPGAAPALQQAIAADRRLNAEAISEREYYQRQTTSALPIQFMGTIVALIMAAGSILAAMNTMSAAVARRAPEIGTLRILGFSRAQILASFLAESMLLGAVGGVIGILLVLPMRNWTSSIGSFTTFAELSFQFHLTPGAMVAGIVAATLIGAAGGILPAASAARKEILDALRGSS